MKTTRIRVASPAAIVRLASAGWAFISSTIGTTCAIWELRRDNRRLLVTAFK